MEARVKRLTPVKVLESERRVEEAAVTPVIAPHIIVPDELVLRADEPEHVPKFPASVVEPVEETAKRVVVAVPAVDEPIANAVEAACDAKVPPTNTESWADGVVLPTLTRPLKYAFPVVVEFWRNVFPTSVVEAAKSPLVAFNSEEMVVEPVTANEVEVAPFNEVPPRTVSAAFRLVAPATLSTVPMVEEPVTARLVVVPFVPKKLPSVEEAE